MEAFTIYARGLQSWEKADVEVIQGRVHIVIDGLTVMRLTRIQSEELAKWLASKLAGSS